MAATATDLAPTLCHTDGCGNEASLRCPTCIKLNLPDAHFCSQVCFKQSWNSHKAVHQKARNLETEFSNLLKLTTQPDIYPGFTYTGVIRPYPQTPKRTVPAHIGRPDYADHPKGCSLEEQSAKHSSVIKVLTDEEIEGLKVACKLAREVLDEAAKASAVGVTTDEIDRIVHEACIERECYPSPLGYYGFPKSCCTSVNEVICHGIPDLRPLRDGDLLNVDITVYHRGFHGDLNESFFIGNVDESGKTLVRVTYESLMEAIKIVKPGVKYREIGNVIQKHVQNHGFSVVKTYCGHGIHRLFHTVPNVPHYAKNKAIGIMKAGHSFTIEPMINEGSWQDEHWPDDWTAVTKDGKRSAQFEQTLLVTDSGCEILTARRQNNGQPWFMDGI